MTPSLAISLTLLLLSADEVDLAAIRQLSSRAFRTRELAQRWLAQEMPRVRLLVQIHASSNPDAETRRRCAIILASYRRSHLERLKWWAEVMPERWPHCDMVVPRMYPGMAHCAEPFIPEMLGHDCRSSLFSWYISRGIASPGLERAVGKPDFWQYRVGTLYMVADMERAGAEAWQVRELLEEMRRLEIEWYRQAGQVRP